MYIPPSQYQANLTTGGGLYTLNGEDYKGDFFLVTIGNKETAYTGKNPQDGNPKLLVNIEGNEIFDNEITPEKTFQQQLTSTPSIEIVGGYNDLLKERNGVPYRHAPMSYSPTLTEQEKKLKIFSRYFLKKNNSFSYLEVSKKEYIGISSKNKDFAWDLYDYVQIIWIINGDIYNIYNNNRKKVLNIENIYSPNNPTGKGWKNFSQFFNDNYLKYCQAVNQTGIYNFSKQRTYPSGEDVPNNFPDAYRLGNMEGNEKQQCSNCIFYKNPKQIKSHCSKWMATAKWNYWCKSYQVLNKKIQNNISQLPQTPIQQPQQQTYIPPSSTGGGSSGGGGY